MTELIDRHLRHCRAAGLAQTTINKRGDLLRRLDVALPMGLGQATTEELEDFLAGFAGPQTKATYYGHIVGFFRWATDPRRPLIDFDPSSPLNRPPVPRPIPRPASDEQVAHAMRTLELPWLAAVALGAYEGARCIEIARVSRADITERATRLFGKGNKSRVIKTHAEVWRIVEPLPPGPIVRRADGGGSVDAHYVSELGRYHFRSIGLDGLTMHMLRHWYATTQLKPVKYGGAGASIRTVQENLGHASVRSTAVYTFASDEERADAVDALPSFSTRDPS